MLALLKLFQREGAEPPRRIDKATEEQILHNVNNDSTSSTREIAKKNQGISYMKVPRILRTNLFYPFYVQRVQALKRADSPRTV